MKRLLQRIQSRIILSIVNRLLAYVDQEIEAGTAKERARLRKIKRTFMELKRWIADPTSEPSDPNRRRSRRVLIPDPQQVVQGVTEIPG
jgi:hypothetical protein